MVHNNKFPAMCVPLNFRLFTKVLSILFPPPPANVPVSLTAVLSAPDTNTFKNFEMEAQWGTVNGTYSSCNFQSLDKCCMSGHTDTHTHTHTHTQCHIFWYQSCEQSYHLVTETLNVHAETIPYICTYVLIHTVVT